MQGNKERTYFLDALKIMSCLLVVMMHTLRNFDSNVSDWPILYYLTRCSVPLFFMVPGAIQLNKKSLTFSYCLGKVKGIIFILIFYYGIDFIIRFLFFDKLSFRIDSLKSVYYDFGAFWFLWSLIILYLILPFVYAFYKKNKWILTALLFSICIAWALIDDYNILILGSNDTIQKIVPQYLRLWNWLFYMCLGAILYKHVVMPKVSRVILFMSVVFVSASAVFYMYYLYHVKSNIVNGEYAYVSFLMMVWASCLFVFFKTLRFNRYANIISYCVPLLVPIYALHVIVIFQVVRYDFFATPLVQLFAYVVVVTISGLSGLIMQRVPFINRLTSL